MKLSQTWILMILLVLISGITGCAGTKTFTTAARAGDTVAVPIGWQKNLARQNLTVTITPASGSPVTYLPNDPKVRALINLYPDPSSGLVVGTQTAQNLGNNDYQLGNNINTLITGKDREWWQTILLLDLPTSLSIGLATISFSDSAGTNLRPANVEIIPGTGNSNLFNVYNPGESSSFDLLGLYPNALKSLERTTRYEITFNTYRDANGFEVIPHAIQVEFSRMPSVGKPWVINPRGDIKNVVWSDDGANLKVIVTPTNAVTLSSTPGIANQFRFYIAGGIAGLTLTNLKAYDVQGNLMSGITANSNIQ